jgi:tetratricopeptide (TPR) repeat protein
MSLRTPIILLFLWLASIASAQTVRWQRGAANDQLDLLFIDCSPAAVPQPPLVAGLTFTRIGTSTSMTVVNGVPSSTVAVSYVVDSQSGGQVTIPSFEVDTNRGVVVVPSFSWSAAATTQANALASSNLSTPSNSYWVGEVFPLQYTMTTPARLLTQIASDIEWNSAPLVAEDWSNPESGGSTIGGERMVHIIYRSAAYSNTEGQINLEAARQLMNIQTGGTGFGFGLLPRIEQVTVTSNRPAITIRPLPTNAPASFRGAVGQFELTSSVVPTSVTIGEPVTWTLELSGVGNWPDQGGLPARDVSRDFEAVQPTARRTPVNGRLFEAVLAEDVVLVPTRPGTYTLGPVTYTYFDPADGRYHTVRTEPTTVEVTDPDGLSLKMPPPQQATPTQTFQAGDEFPDAPGAPGAIPRDPLPSANSALAPLLPQPFALVLAVPPALLILSWVGLAWRRAVLSDPLRRRRLAERRLKAILAGMRGAGAPSDQQSRQLLDWQRAAAESWGVSHAAPPSEAITDPDWQRLWEEADRAMYSNGGLLPADWRERAGTAHAGRRLRPVNPLRALHWRNLLPFLAIALACALAPHGRAAQAAADPDTAYSQGNFPAAEQSWRAATRQDPRNWVARHNLALALAQQDRWAEAAAHASVAFVQNPRNPSVHWHLTPVLTEAAFAPADILPFARKAWPQSMARYASPTEWQAVIAGAMVIACLSAFFGLLRAYGNRRPWVSRTALSLLLVAALVGTAGVVSLRAYGMTADQRAVLAWRTGTLRSIPTEANATQQTTPMPAGSVAIADRTFLGWLHLRFPNGQTGWVRSGEVVGFWR